MHYDPTDPKGVPVTPPVKSSWLQRVPTLSVTVPETQGNLYNVVVSYVLKFTEACRNVEPLQ